MTKDEAIERVIKGALHCMSAINGHCQVEEAVARLRGALSDFAKAIEASMACTLLTRETEAMGGYDKEMPPHDRPGLPAHDFYNGSTASRACQYRCGDMLNGFWWCGASRESHGSPQDAKWVKVSYTQGGGKGG